jgi:hypothetical protein
VESEDLFYIFVRLIQSPARLKVKSLVGARGWDGRRASVPMLGAVQRNTSAHVWESGLYGRAVRDRLWWLPTVSARRVAVRRPCSRCGLGAASVSGRRECSVSSTAGGVAPTHSLTTVYCWRRLENSRGTPPFQLQPPQQKRRVAALVAIGL